MTAPRPHDPAGEIGARPGLPTDAALLRATAAGDREAFRSLVDRYEKRAFWAAFHLLGDEEEARDVVQEAFVRVFRSLERFDERRPFYTWFYRIVTNLAIDHLRHLRLTRRIAAEEATEMLAGGSAPSSSLEANETRRVVRQALDALPPKFKTVMVLRELHGLSCKEIAGIVSSTHATVRWRLHRARKLFREAFERQASKGAR
jgi:RNA polymerase sigma-70 factor, ECF subfamily